MKFCSNCGKELKDGADVCVSCGKAVNGASAPVTGAGTTNPVQGACVAALVCGILSVILGWVPIVCFVALALGIVAIVLGVKGRKGSPAGKTGLATAGMVIGIIGVCLASIYSLCYICAGSVIDDAADDLNDALREIEDSNWDY